VVATVAGHVLVTAELVDCHPVPGGARSACVPLLAEAGDWRAAFAERVLPTPPGNSWLLWEPVGARSWGFAFA
jgi:hypothetical protein